jgi:uncharacterized membrane protein YdjX (TVP38/TMEM64 family)
VKLSRSWTLVACGGALAIAALAWLARGGMLEQTLQRVESLGAWGPLALVGVYVVASVLFVPGLILNLAAGALFGVVVGSLCALAGSTLGAIAAFLVGRAVARKHLAERLRSSERAAALDAAVGKEGFKVVVLSRLSPGLPFNVINYLFGLTRVSFRDFALGSLVGMLPFRVAYAWIGAVAGTFAEATGEGGALDSHNWALLAGGLCVTVGFSIWIARIARRAMRAELEAARRA